MKIVFTLDYKNMFFFLNKERVFELSTVDAISITRQTLDICLEISIGALWIWKRHTTRMVYACLRKRDL